MLKMEVRPSARLQYALQGTWGRRFEELKMRPFKLAPALKFRVARLRNSEN
jgi:hypothetical protein